MSKKLAFTLKNCYNLNMKEIKLNLAKNLIKLRQNKKLTQIELGKQLNYSDKSISKWEHGEAVPPIEVLKTIADFYNVSVDFLINDNDENLFEKLNRTNTKANKIIITMLSVSFVWLIATCMFFYSYTLKQENLWIAFVGAVPFSIIVLIFFNAIWGKKAYLFILLSIFIWSTLALIYLQTLEKNLWLIFILGIPLQIVTILWSQIKSSKNKL